MSVTFQVQLAGQTVPLRFQTVSFGGIREIVEADLTVDINARAAKSANLSDLASAPTALANLGGAAKSANLSDLASPATARTNIGADLAANVNFTPAGTGAVVRSAQAKLRDMAVSAQDFGAVGDGVTNDRAAIQAAIDAVNDAGGGEVWLPMKQYLLGTTGLTMRGNVVLKGAVGRFSGNPGGPGTRGTTLTYSGTGAAIFGQNILDSQILNLDIDCSGATGTSVRGIHLSGVWKTTLRNVTIRGVTPAKGYAILFDTVGVSGPFGGQHNYLEQVECQDGIIRLQGASSSDGVTTTVLNTVRGSQYQIYHSQGVAINATAEAWTTGPGWSFDGDGTDFQMVGCDIEGAGSPAIQITNGADVRETGTVWKGFTGAVRVSGDVASLRTYGGAIEFKSALVADTPKLIGTYGNSDADFASDYLIPTNVTGGSQTGYRERRRMIGGAEFVFSDEGQWAVIKKTVNVATTSQVTLASLPVAPTKGATIEVTVRGFQPGDGWFNITRTADVINGNPLIITQPAQRTTGALNQLSFSADDTNDLVLVRWAATTATSTDVEVTVRVLGAYAGYT